MKPGILRGCYQFVTFRVKYYTNLSKINGKQKIKSSLLGRKDFVPLKDVNARTRRYVEAGKRKIVYRSIGRDFANSSMSIVIPPPPTTCGTN
jgi:hypothetical protein